jgi:hypothetical protein
MGRRHFIALLGGRQDIAASLAAGGTRSKATVDDP